MSSIEEGNIPEADLPKDNIELIRQKLEDTC